MKPSTLDNPVGSPAGRYSCSDRKHDIGVVGCGTTLERAFESAAEATFALMADLSHLRAERTLPVSFLEADEARALVRWLDLLIAAAREHRLVFSEFHLQREKGRWWGCATGERRDSPVARDVEVKRSGIAVKRTARGWEASCVVQCRPRTPPIMQPPPSQTAAVE